MEYVRTIKWESNGSGRIKWLTAKGKTVEADEVLATVEVNRQSVNIKATARGIVTQIYVPRGGSFYQGQVLCEINTCAHPLLLSKLCVVCGANVGASLRPVEMATSKVHAATHGKEFQITQRSAEAKQESFKKELMQQRKLYLILDLDSTILHAAFAHDREPEDPQLNYFRCSGQKWKVKFRPGLAEFLEKVNEKFVIHVYTNAMKEYADHIVRLMKERYGPQSIFPDGEIRVLSRDDTKDFVKRLSQILPNIETYSLIVDDREDVWHTCLENVVPIHPYLFFEGEGDPNDPALFANPITPKREREQEAVIATREVKKQKVIEGPIKIRQVDLPYEIGIDESLYANGEELKNLEWKILKEKLSIRSNNSIKKPSMNNALLPRNNVNNNNAIPRERLPQSVSAPRSAIVNNSLPSPMPALKNIFDLPSLKKKDSPLALTTPLVQFPIPPSELPSEVTGMEIFIAQNSFGFEENLDATNAEMVVERNGEDYTLECEPLPETKHALPIVAESNPFPNTLSANSLVHPSSNSMSIGKVLIGNEEVDFTDEEMAEEYERQLEAAILKEEDDRSDTHLLSVYQVLDDVHAAFFAEMDRNPRSPPDVRTLLRHRRKSALAGCSLLFTGVFPNTSDPRTTREWIDAERFGARCHLAKNKEITHIVAGKPGTDKVMSRTVQDCMFVVSCAWLKDSALCWSRKEERHYPLLDPIFGATCPVIFGQPPRIVAQLPPSNETRLAELPDVYATSNVENETDGLSTLLRQLTKTADAFYSKSNVSGGGKEQLLSDSELNKTNWNILKDLNVDLVLDRI